MRRSILAIGSAVAAAAVGATAVAVWPGGDDPFGDSTIAPSILAAPDGTVLAAGLERPASCQDLAATMVELQQAYGIGTYGVLMDGAIGGFGMDDMAVEESMDADEAMDMPVSEPVPMAPQVGEATGRDGGAELAASDADEDTTGVGGTNVQEAGVDEDDIVERVGDLIVSGTEGTLRVVSVDGGTPTLRGELPLVTWGGDLGIFAVGDDRVAVIAPDHGDEPVRPASADSMVRPGGWASTLVILVDLSDPDAPRELSRLQLEGWAVDARAVDGVIRLAVRGEGPQVDVWAAGDFEADRAMNWETATDEDYREYDRRFQAEYEERMEQALAQVEPAHWQPHVRISTPGGASSTVPMVDCDRIGFPSSFAGMGTLTLAAIDATGDTLAIDDAEAVVAGGENVYATTDRVVIATTRWDVWEGDDVVVEEPPAVEVDPFFEEGESSSGDVGVSVEPVPAPDAPEAEAGTLPMIEPGIGMIAPWGGPGGATDLHVFDVEGTLVTHVASGAVEGSLLNQFAMSIHEGVLRVATTKWEDGTSESGVTTLRVDGDALATLGSVWGLGATETIRSVRFMGDVGYVVTFRQTDPLYVIDLADPTAPRAVGELKIEGYSAYLHPIAPGILLGVGQDADPETGWTRGVQVSTFDVTDMTAPTRIDVDVTPDSHSEVEWDHHALMVAADRLTVLPIEMWSPTQRLGALVYDVSESGELTRIGMLDSGNRWELRPRRTVDLGETLLTVGDRGVIAWDRSTFEPLADVEFDAPQWWLEEEKFHGDGDFGGCFEERTDDGEVLTVCP